MRRPESVGRTRWLTVVCGVVGLLELAGCQQDPTASLDSTTQALMQFVGDFARQALAAYLF